MSLRGLLALITLVLLLHACGHHMTRLARMLNNINRVHSAPVVSIPTAMSEARSKSETKVLELVDHYRRIDLIHPLISDLSEVSPGLVDMFRKLLKHESFIIRSRSQDFRDNEITIVQKAFVILFENDDGSVPAIELWINEILGINQIPEETRRHIFSAAIRTRVAALDRTYDFFDYVRKGPQTVLTNHYTCLGLQEYQNADQHPHYSHSAPEAFATAKDHNVITSKPTNATTTKAEDRNKSHSNMPKTTASYEMQPFVIDTAGDLSLKAQASDPKLKRLLDMYQKTKKDFESTDPKGIERTKSAKFLRDTVENCLSYLNTKEKHPSNSRAIVEDPMVEELKSTLAQAAAIVQKGSGGKKRRFDEVVEHTSKVQAHMRPPTLMAALPTTVSQWSGLPQDVRDHAPAAPSCSHAHPTNSSRLSLEQRISHPAEHHPPGYDSNIQFPRQPPGHQYDLADDNWDRSQAERTPQPSAKRGNYADCYRPSYK